LIVLVIRNYQQREIAADRTQRALEGKELNPYALASHRDDPVNIHDANYSRGFVFPAKSGCVSSHEESCWRYSLARGGGVMHRWRDPHN
jgi:hypothetical protein